MQIQSSSIVQRFWNYLNLLRHKLQTPAPETATVNTSERLISSGSPAIPRVSTSITGFIGCALSGPLNAPIGVLSFLEYERRFGGLWSDSPMSYAVWHFFMNGGQEAVVVRVAPSALPPKPPKVKTIGFEEIAHPSLRKTQCGLWAFDKVDLLNVLCIPPFSFQTDVDLRTWQAAVNYCKSRRAFLLVDPPSTWNSAEDAITFLENENAALYFPRITTLDPLNGNLPKSLAPCGAVAGVLARMDTALGVWKAPVGPSASLLGTTGLSVSLSDADYEKLNPRGINCLRNISPYGFLIWGARTMARADPLDAKYVNVRRLRLFIEESLERGLKWVKFEPNGEPLWAKIRLEVGTFLNNLFSQGAFQGNTPEDAYFVKCGIETTTQNEIDMGIVNIIVGFAPIKPAEFVIIKIQ